MYSVSELLTASLVAHANRVSLAFSFDQKGNEEKSRLYWGQAELLLNIANYLSDGSEFSDTMLSRITDIIEFIDSNSLDTLYNLSVIEYNFTLPIPGGGVGGGSGLSSVSVKVGEQLIKVTESTSNGITDYQLSSEYDGISLYDKVTGIDNNLSSINDRIDGLGNEFLSKDDTVTESVTSNGVGSIGGISDGMTIPAGMSFQEFLNALLVKAIPATYTQSTSSISDNVDTTIEIGQTFSPVLTITYNQNDSGAPIESRFYKNGILINTDSTIPFQHTASSEDFSVDGQTLQYSGQVDHQQGAQKFDNLGNPSGDPSVLVPARVGLTTNTITIYGRRRIFYGKNNQAPSGVEDVRSFQWSQFSTINTFSVSVSVGDVSVEIGIPSHKTLSSAIFVGSLTNDETSTFLSTEQIVSTNGAENKYPDNYKVYRYVPSVPFGSNAVYNFTLS